MGGLIDSNSVNVICLSKVNKSTHLPHQTVSIYIILLTLIAVVYSVQTDLMISWLFYFHHGVYNIYKT